MSDMAEIKRFHRIRFYPNGFSNFDDVKPCPTGPGKSCWGCEYKHVFCDENGRVSRPTTTEK
jgi:hypothetical protein